MTRSHWRVWGPVVLWLAVIWTVNSLPRRTFSEGIRKSPHADHYAHVLLYVPLGVFLMRALSPTPVGWRRGWRTVAVVVLLGAVLAGLDEWHKVFIPTRKGEVPDWFRDVVGTALGALAWGGWQWAVGRGSGSRGVPATRPGHSEAGR